MTLHLPNLDTVPPGGWHYLVPETGQRFEGSSLSELMHNLAAHYRAAGYPQPPNLARLVEDQICADRPEGCGGTPRATHSDDAMRQGWLKGLKHTFTNVVTGTRTLAAWIAGGRHYVDADTANSRAAVCIACPENVEPQGCTGCNLKTLHEVVRGVVGSRTTPHDTRLKACKVCGCDLRAKVHLPHKVLWEHMADSQKTALPAHCWLIKGQLDALTSGPTTTALSGGTTVIDTPLPT